MMKIANIPAIVEGAIRIMEKYYDNIMNSGIVFISGWRTIGALYSFIAKGET